MCVRFCLALFMLLICGVLLRCVVLCVVVMCLVDSVLRCCFVASHSGNLFVVVAAVVLSEILFSRGSRCEFEERRDVLVGRIKTRKEKKSGKKKIEPSDRSRATNKQTKGQRGVLVVVVVVAGGGGVFNYARPESPPRQEKERKERERAPRDKGKRRKERKSLRS
ncbi:MAG: hypothetical protein J3R72DRAFT_442562 [Linnemannia gamsii]|nr:MAG: hypothetical protein J3R72DRAFT_442562 [Linnemannia gamsii]